MNESEAIGKIEGIRKSLKLNGLNAVRFRGVDFFSWITSGGDSFVILTSETGVAEVLITDTEAMILTSKIEAARLREEEIPNCFTVCSFSWVDELTAIDEFVTARWSQGVASDRPQKSELPLPNEIRELKVSLTQTEITRYRQLGHDAGEAMMTALLRAESTWSENELAGEGAKELWRRGIQATLVLVAGEERLLKYRHPIPKSVPLGGRAMMVFCGRRHGLYANLTRFIYFREPTDQETQLHKDLFQIEDAAFSASKIGARTSDVFESLEKQYMRLGYPEEIHNHHQGGPTGYLSREEVARPFPNSRSAQLSRPSIVLRSGMALAWNPSLTGAKVEDTCLLTDEGIEILTVIEGWPSVEFNNRNRPWIWVTPKKR